MSTSSKLWHNLYSLKDKPNQWHKVVVYGSTSGASVALNSIKKGNITIPSTKKCGGCYIFTARVHDLTSSLYACFVIDEPY